MSLSRLSNFLRSVRGTIIYVDPNCIDSTDSIENTGNSLARPFKTIQRALIESARFSYQKGLNNDRFGKTTILLYPGDHIIDNRPGWIPLNDGINYQLRSGEVSNNLPPFDATTNFNLESTDNALYKLNSVHGGVIVPRGTSIVGLDLRKTKIRPKYVPNPTNDNVRRSSIFRVTGACYFWQFSIFDADPNGQCFKDYTDNIFVPNFSHHKLSCFEYADGVNPVSIEDEFLTYSDPERTDLDMYYEKIGKVYGFASGRAIEPDYPSVALDIEPKIDEYRIVGSTGLSVGISSIFSGDGSSSSTTISVVTSEVVPGLEVDTPIRIEGVSGDGYNGSFVVSEKLSPTYITYSVQNAPVNASPAFTGSILSLSSDTVTSASPYIFNCSLRSVYGMCGVLADGSKASGFKSMVIAQFTGIGLQKDDNAFVLYNETTGIYEDSTVVGNETISSNSRAIHKPSYRNFHIKSINDAFIQNVSIFAIGYAEQFATESGGDQSITNSNSNFGAKALVATGFRKNAFRQDDYGYITHIIPPKEIEDNEVSVEFNSIDVQKTIDYDPFVPGRPSGRIYLYNQTNRDVPPEHVIEGYRFGARRDDTINVLISNAGVSTEFSSRIVMSNSTSTSEKVFYVGNNIAGISSISGNIVTLTEQHTLENGESVRIISENGELPDGLIPNTIYYAITTGLDSDQLKIAKTLNDANNLQSVSLNNKGGSLKIESRVSDKSPGDLGHPIQYDDGEGLWYVNVATSLSDNQIYQILADLGTATLGPRTSRTYFKRIKSGRNSIDTIYRARYVIPAETGGSYARPPSDGFIIQETNNCTGESNTEILTYFGSGSLTDVNQQRNFKFIANAEWDSLSNIAKITTELPHKLSIGDGIELVNVSSTLNADAVQEKGFNRNFSVVGIASAKQFNVGLSTDPGTFSSDTSVRNTSLPYFRRKNYNNTYFIYRSQEVQPYINNRQDGIYYLTLLNASNSPSIPPFNNDNYSQPVKELFPQINRDNPQSDPPAAISNASSSLIGEVVVNDVRNSITKETVDKIIRDSNVGFGITDILSTNESTHVFRAGIDHGLNRITKINVNDSGAGYDSGGSTLILYNVKLAPFDSNTTGDHATAKVTITPSGNIGDITIMDGGSAYGIGNTLTIVGVATTTPFAPASIEVTEIYNNVGDTIVVSGVSSSNFANYNNIYRISDVPVGSTNIFTAVSSTEISEYTTTGITTTTSRNAYAYISGKSERISDIVYDNNSGFATVTTIDNHGLSVGNKIRMVGSDSSLYNGDFVVTENISLNQFGVNVGLATTVPTVSGTIYAYRKGVTSNSGDISQSYENISGRMVTNYAGITTTLRVSVTDETDGDIYIEGIDRLDVKIGDFFQINDEIVRVKEPVLNTILSTDPVSVFRGVLGTKASTHVVGSVIKRVDVNPVELRRHSILRASGHTFEYVGFGPGNYSTAFPDKQDRQISPKEELLAQSTRRSGGITFYTGMNDKGISYTGNRKSSSITGQEEIFEVPVQTITGEDIGNLPSLDIINPIEATFGRSIKVEGGEGSKSISEFNGPVIFNEKITSNSLKGVEVNSLFLQGEAKVSRKYTVGKVGNEKPTILGNPGDVQYNANPSGADYLGWVYTSDNEWKRFAKIEPDDNIGYIVQNDDNSLVGISSIVKFQSSNIVITPTFTQTSYSDVYESPIGVVTYDLVGVGTADVLQDRTLIGSPGSRWFTVPTVELDGSMDIGRYLDFHYVDGNATDYTYRLDNDAEGNLTASGSLGVNSSISLGGQLKFTSSNDKYIDFYTNDGVVNYTAYLRLVNDANTSFHNGISITRGGAVSLYHNNVSKLSTSSSGISVIGTVTASTFSGNLIGNVTGNLTGNITNTVTGNNSTELVRGNMGNNDQFRILIGATGNDAGFVEIATADNGNEPIYVRQYSGLFSSITRTATLLNSSGNTSFPGTVTAPTFTGTLNGNAATATNANAAGISTNSTNINISAINSSDTNTSVVLVAAQSTGAQQPFIDAGLRYNANTNTLTSGTFIGNLTGNATSSDTVDTTATSNNATYYVTFVDSASSSAGETIRVDGGITYNPSTNTLSTSNLNSTSSIQISGTTVVDSSRNLTNIVSLDTTVTKIWDSITTTSSSKNLINRECCTVTASNVTLTLPSSPTAGNEIAVIVAGDTILNTVINRNGSPIMGLSENMTMDLGNAAVIFVYVNSTYGWRVR